MRQGKSAPALARVSDVSVDTIRSLESGRVPRPSFLTIAQLADALGLSLDQLQADARRVDQSEKSRG